MGVDRFGLVPAQAGSLSDINLGILSGIYSDILSQSISQSFYGKYSHKLSGGLFDIPSGWHIL